MAQRQAGSHGKSRNGTKKYGRNLAKCKKYRDRGRREKNKARRMAKLAQKFARRKAKRAC